MMRKIKVQTLLAGLFITGMLAGPLPVQAEDSHYTVKDLLQPCREGDNDSRGGLIDELECEQYINGVIDAVSLTRNLMERGICLPSINKRPDDIRRAFVKWAYDHHDQQTEPAAKGVLRSLQTAFSCKK